MFLRSKEVFCIEPIEKVEDSLAVEEKKFIPKKPSKNFVANKRFFVEIEHFLYVEERG